MEKRRAIYPGTFDPITYGHVDLIERALQIFDELIVLVAHSGKKKPLFNDQERCKMIQQCFSHKPQVKVQIHSALLADFAKQNGIPVIVRGLRAVSDFEYEFQMALMNKRMFHQLETYFLMASEKYFFVNSTMVKEVCSHQGNVSEFVPPHVEKLLKERLC